MSSLADVIKPDAPRLVIAYKCGDNGEDLFQWGVVGEIPLLSLIGGIVRVLADMTFSRDPRPVVDNLGGWKQYLLMHCEEQVFVLIWNSEHKEFMGFVNKDIPRDPLLGMLEIAKGTLVNSRLAQQAAAQQMAMQTGLVSANGQPILRPNGR